MGAFKDTYDIIKDLLKAAKAVQNQEVVQLAMDLQEKFFELREDNQNLLDEVKALKTKLEEMEKADLLEEDIEYSHRGFFTLKNETHKIPYCSFCWKKEKKLYPLSQFSSWMNFECANCKSKIIVMTDSGNQLNH